MYVLLLITAAFSISFYSEKKKKDITYFFNCMFCVKCELITYTATYMQFVYRLGKLWCILLSESTNL